MKRRSGQHPVRFDMFFSDAQAKKLQDFALILRRSHATILRQLLDQATLEDLPQAWLIEIEEARARQEGQP